uniref:NADH dehydrogenase subunit 5 n=1 Tax=Dendroctonus rufipennis TaxID=77170 RepID=UPI0020284104|nr:NADH dehydrogenase subunit 5 [Dendroctonus rufipennis]UQK95006.1 NADH dehydrogenase subunit 5 [Dendroctonus rufipennis]
MSCKINFWSFLFFSIFLVYTGVILLYSDYSVYLEVCLINLNSLVISYVAYIDWITLIFMGFVLFISSMIFKYTENYMEGDLNLKRFILLVVLFIFSMMLMIMSLNLVTILLGWDLLGLVSYILVIYYQNVKSFNAGMLTALSNRIGDASLLMSIALASSFGSWNFLFYLDFFNNDVLMSMLYSFMVLAALTKSAQIPFSSWLPAAMAAPTPVSSLVHSSTLVTAGVYLLIRIESGISSSVLFILLFISLLTMFMAGACANFEYDLKKIIALSTLSQLGMMIVILCLGGGDLAFFHLIMHALFKALLFMCAGMIIHSMGNCQDIRYMSGFTFSMPFTCTCMNISNFALCGLPFMSGFYSKDLIVEIFSLQVNSIVLYFLFYMSIGLTVSYSFRLSYYIFFGSNNLLSLNQIMEKGSPLMMKGMTGLVFFVIFMGSAMSWLIHVTPYFILLPLSMKLFTLNVVLLGGYLGYEFNNMSYFYTSKISQYHNISMFMGQMWNLPIMSSYLLNQKFLFMGKFYFKNFDQGWLEYYGSKGLFMLLFSNFNILQLNSLNHLKKILFFSLIMIIILSL